MVAIHSLPNRPLRQSDINAFERNEKITACMPIYTDESPAMAAGLVLIIHHTAIAFAYGDTGWESIERRTLDTIIHDGDWNELDSIQELQRVARATAETERPE